MAGVRTANPQVDIMRFGLSISASTATKVGRISSVAARAGECPLTETDSGCLAGEAKLVFLLRVFGRLPITDVTRYSEAGVRKASGEETAGEFAPTLVSIYGEFAAAA